MIAPGRIMKPGSTARHGRVLRAAINTAQRAELEPGLVVGLLLAGLANGLASAVGAGWNKWPARCARINRPHPAHR